MSSTRLALAYLFVLVFAAPASAAPPPPQCVNPGATNGCFADVQSAINAASRGALIAIAAGTYTGTVTVDRSLILEGADRDTTILDGGAGGSVVTTLPGTTVTLANLTIQNGTGTSTPNGGSGGGIFGAGRLTISNTTIRDNSTSCGSCSQGGGGIFFGDRKGTLTLVDSAVVDNTSAYGGGIHVIAGKALISNSTISGNMHGGITDINGNHRVQIQVSGSTISDNSGFGAGLHVEGHAKVSNCTISDNESDSYCTTGIESEGAVAQILFSTIADNSSTYDCQGFGVGLQAGGKVSMRGTILSGNAGPFDHDCAGAFKSLGSNLVLVLDTTKCTAQGKASATLVGIDPELGPLQHNGGPTETMAPDPNSPVLGVATHCPKTDQRGDPRSHHCDIGAVESEM